MPSGSGAHSSSGRIRSARRWPMRSQQLTGCRRPERAADVAEVVDGADREREVRSAVTSRPATSAKMVSAVAGAPGVAGRAGLSGRAHVEVSAVTCPPECARRRSRRRSAAPAPAAPPAINRSKIAGSTTVRDGARGWRTGNELNSPGIQVPPIEGMSRPGKLSYPEVRVATAEILPMRSPFRSGLGCGRPTDHPRRAGAQPARRQPGSAPRRHDRVHRAVRFRQVEPRVRHDLRRGPATLRRVTVLVRAAVPRPDGQARRRLHRGPQSRPSRSTRSRPRATRARRSARSPRSTTTCACCSRGSASRTARSAASRSPGRARSRSSTGCSRWPRAPGSRCSPRSSAAARANTSTSSPSCSPRASRGPGSTAWCTR